MKLASYKDGSRDGQLLVVSRDLVTAHYATGIATRLQQVLDDWNFLSPQLEALSQELNHGKARHSFAFDPGLCMAPLPRAGLWAEGRAYAVPGEPARGAADASLMRLGRSDELLGPRDLVPWARSAEDTPPALDFEGQLAVICGDLAPGTGAAAALDGIRLLMLATSLRQRAAAPDDAIGTDLARAFSPVAVTPDELGLAWRGGRVHLTLEVHHNGKRLGLCETGPEMAAHFGQLASRLAQQRGLRAGSIIGSGAVANEDTARGHASLAHCRARELAETGQALTAWLQPGDTVRLDIKGSDGASLFGSIDVAVAAAD